jgi:carboxymethylenebutenolidase
MALNGSMTTLGNGTPAYVSNPAGNGPFPAVIVYIEAFGLNENIKRICDRLASEGYVALAPDLYSFDKDNVAAYTDMPKAMGLMGKFTDEKLVDDAGASIRFLKSQKNVSGKIGTTGFCMGGRLAFLTACEFPDDIQASAHFYGGISAARPGKTLVPMDEAPKLKCPVLLNYAEKDAHIVHTVEVPAVEARLKALGKKYEVVVHQGADHGFMCDDRAAFHAEASKAGWAKMLGHFKANLS